MAHDPLIFPRTYFAMNADGVFFETERGSIGFDAIVADIVDAQREDITRVFRATCDRWEDVTSLVVDAVYDKLRRGDGPYIPPFLDMHDRVNADALRDFWKTPEDRAREQAEAMADWLYESRRDAMFHEAAE